jgi:hypothetical protein
MLHLNNFNDINLYQNIQYFSIIIVTVISVGVAYKLYNRYATIYYINRVRQVEAERAQENLPTEVSLTPEDFRLNPELAEIFEVTDLDNELDLNLETNEQLNVQEHLDNNMDFIFGTEEFLEHLGDQEVLDYLMGYYEPLILMILDFFNLFF